MSVPGSLALDDVRVLVCPACRGGLDYRGAAPGGRLLRGELGCGGCARTWAVVDGLPRLADEERIEVLDRLMRWCYDRLAPVHDLAVDWLLPVLQGSPSAPMRDAYLRRLELDAAPPASGRPFRVLEVGVGAGANLPLVERELGADVPAELWGCDLSDGMLAQCRERLARHRGRPLRLLLADAHALPFATASMDRVFHVGGIAGYADPGRALAEMARVARPGTPIVVVDEQLDSARAYGLLRRLAFRAITFYSTDPIAPRAHLPRGAIEVAEEQVSGFYYCLRFRMPAT